MIDELGRQHIAGPTHTALDATRPVSQADHDAVENILNPNVPAGAASPAMTGTGVGGAYETEMLAGLNALAARVTGGLAATPAADMAQAEPMSDLAQARVLAPSGRGRDDARAADRARGAGERGRLLEGRRAAGGPEPRLGGAARDLRAFVLELGGNDRAGPSR